MKIVIELTKVHWRNWLQKICFN